MNLGSNPLNLALAFLLELAGITSMAIWGWTQHQDIARWLWAIGLPVIAAAIWGIFRVDDDPGKAPVRIPGWLRLTLELTFYTLSITMLAAANHPTAAAIFAALTILHYFISIDHIRWLLAR